MQSEVTIFWSDWSDADSGIGEIFYTIHSMALDHNGKLTEQNPPLVNSTWEDDDDPPTYTPPQPGTYR